MLRCLRVGMGIVAIFGWALPAAAVQMPATAPVKITRCEPKQNQSSPPIYHGYTPAYYPSGRITYYWTDIYGRRVFEYPLPTAKTLRAPELFVDFTNVGHLGIREIEFGLVAKGTVVSEVRDVGTFAPRAEIRHRYGLDPNIFPLGTASPECVPLRLTYADGTTWESPNRPPRPR